jgi:hypothetical protein
LLFRNGPGERLFSVNVFLVVGRFRGHQGVPMIRNGQHDRVDVGSGHHFAVIVVRFAILVLVMAVDPVESGLQMVFVQVAGGDDVAILELEKFAGVAGTLHAPTDDSQCHALRRSGFVTPAEGTGGDDRRHGNRRAGRGDKSATADSSFGGGGFHSEIITPDSRRQIQYKN